MNKPNGENMESHQNNIYSIKNYQKRRINHHSHTFAKPIKNKNNICPLKPEFKQYIGKNTKNHQTKSTIKAVFASVITIGIWSFAMCLLAKVSYDVLQAICIHSVQVIKSDRLN
ncbi:MAG: hypothetical protein WBA41_05705 [Rivularia sp. (in: cyanobacteria)]